MSQRAKDNIIELGQNVSICLSQIEGLQIKRSEVDKDSYNLFILRPGRSLSIWLDIDEKTKILSIGDREYLLKENKLVELAKSGWFDIGLRRSAENREFTLRKSQDGKIIIDVNQITGNPKINEFFDETG